ncbi:MAG: PEP-CTERM sorting domain-containing protein [Lentisphaerae bacterium]|nr:PEP-CTERM sorting domain-containing protein [Lentisphaerota bacterium]
MAARSLIPEPSSAFLIMIGAGSLIFFRRLRKR